MMFVSRPLFLDIHIFPKCKPIFKDHWFDVFFHKTETKMLCARILQCFPIETSFLNRQFFNQKSIIFKNKSLTTDQLWGWCDYDFQLTPPLPMFYPTLLNLPSSVVRSTPNFTKIQFQVGVKFIISSNSSYNLHLCKYT